jgi:PHD/YefM family antitoxin component YafN of YafNO toxin-antitoxin module
MPALRKRAAGEVRERFADIINEAVYSSTRTVVMRHDKPVAAVVPIADLELLNEIERMIDVAEAERVIAEAEAEGFDKLMTLEQLLQKLGS